MGQPPFVDDAAIAAAAAQARLSPGFIGLLRDTGHRLTLDSTLLDAVRRAHHVLYETEQDAEPALRHLDAVAGSVAGQVRLLLVLDVIRLLRERQGSRGVPDAVTESVIDGQPGAWLRQAQQEQDVETGAARFAADGYLTGDLAWTSRCRRDDEAVVANPVRPSGHADQRQARLPIAEWEQVLGPGDRVLDLHVPAEGGRLTLATLRDSLEQAGPFFDRFHPDRPFVAFFCASWLFSPQLPAILDEDSGILDWQREGYLCPDKGRPGGVLRWVFGTRTLDPGTAKSDTRLRAGLLALVTAGESLRTGRWLFGRSDLPRFGEQPYRNAGQAILRTQGGRTPRPGLAGSDAGVRAGGTPRRGTGTPP